MNQSWCNNNVTRWIKQHSCTHRQKLYIKAFGRIEIQARKKNVTEGTQRRGSASTTKLSSHHHNQQQQRSLLWVSICVRAYACACAVRSCAARKITPVHTGLWFWRLTCGSVHHCEKHENWEPASHRTSERKERTSELNPQGEHTREAFHSGHFSLLFHCCCMTVRLFILAFLF